MRLCAFGFAVSLAFTLHGAAALDVTSYKPISIAKLQDSMGNLQKTEQLNGKRVVVEGLVHGYAEFSVYLDLRANADRFVGTDDEHPDVDQCVGLAVPENLFGKVKGAHTLRVYGTTFVLGNLQGVIHGTASYRGVKFFPECGYFSEKALYILVDHIEMASGRSN